MGWGSRRQPRPPRNSGSWLAVRYHSTTPGVPPEAGLDFKFVTQVHHSPTYAFPYTNHTTVTALKLRWHVRSTLHPAGRTLALVMADSWPFQEYTHGHVLLFDSISYRSKQKGWLRTDDMSTGEGSTRAQQRCGGSRPRERRSLFGGDRVDALGTVYTGQCQSIEDAMHNKLRP